jgi:hypothetical protein
MLTKQDIRIIDISKDIEILKHYAIEQAKHNPARMWTCSRRKAKEHSLVYKYAGAKGEFALSVYLYGYEVGKQLYMKKMDRYLSNRDLGDGGYDINYLGFPLDVKTSSLFNSEHFNRMKLFVDKRYKNETQVSKTTEQVKNTVYALCFAQYLGFRSDLKDDDYFLKAPWKYDTGKVYIVGWTFGWDLIPTTGNPRGIHFYQDTVQLLPIDTLDTLLTADKLTPQAKQLVAEKIVAEKL